MHYGNKLTIYSNGIGSFQREYDVPAGKDKDIELLVSKKNLDDVLASFTVRGHVKLVSPPKFRPCEDKANDLNNNNIFINLATSYAGAEVLVKPSNIKGTLLGLHSNNTNNGGETYQMHQLVILTENNGLTRINIENVDNLIFTQDAVKNEIQKAKERMYQKVTPQSSVVKMILSSKEDSKALVQYMVPFSPWRPTYRIIKDNDKCTFTGFAVINNPTDENLNGFNVEVVSGEPSTFEKQDLSSPTVVKRQKMNLTPVTAVAAQKIDASIESVQTLGYAQVGFAPMAASASAKRSIEPLPQAVIKSAETAEVGDFCIFKLNGVVDLPAKESCTLPIFDTELKNNKVVLHYKHSLHKERPWSSIKFKNDTNFSLSEGYCSIWENGTWVGEAIMPLMKNGEEKLISYGLETGVRIVKEEGEQKREFSQLKFSDSCFYTSHRIHKTSKYIIKNNKENSFIFNFDHEYSFQECNFEAELRKKGSKKKIESEKIPNGVRFNFIIDAKEELVLTVDETTIERGQATILSSKKMPEVYQYLSFTKGEFSNQSALKSIFDVQKFIDDNKHKSELVLKTISDLEKEQENLRRNIEVAKSGESHALYNKWIGKLDSLIDEHNKLNKNLSDLMVENQKLEEELHKKFRVLNCEWNAKD